MTEAILRRNNHYVAQSYLKRWLASPGKICVYRTLVTHENVPLWTEKSIKGVARQQNLYTRKIAGFESDEIERYFDQEFEFPAEEAIHKAVTGQCLTPDDWKKLVQNLAMHDLRTPARLMEHLTTYEKRIISLLDNILDGLRTELETGPKQGVSVLPTSVLSGGFPLRTIIEDNKEEGSVRVKLETAVGRASWLWSINHLLKGIAKVLHTHKWTIVRPAEGMYWPTSDNPVVKLNYYGEGKYDFKSGWGTAGAELLMPLSPQHLLYTWIGRKAPSRNNRCSMEQTQFIRRIIMENAHRRVFSHIVDPEIAKVIPRKVDAELFEHEKKEWQNWHTEQTKSEDYLLTKP